MANADFVTLVDSENIFGTRYDLKAIPYGVMVDEAGRLVKGPFNINVADEKTRAMLEKWLSDPDYNAKLLRDVKPLDALNVQTTPEATARFQLGLVLLEIDKKEEAMAEWRKALALDPQNWIIHKQIWAVEHPDKFYKNGVDYGWQKTQLEAEESEPPEQTPD
ncbi:tetratricopeptide repeat protein [Candidatus Poribacteria bacterium]|nr:tetratricopeptide repeat protein [Candidatus Poribacteria bacterium]